AGHDIARPATWKLAEALQHAIDPPLDEQPLRRRVQMNIARSDLLPSRQKQLNGLRGIQRAGRIELAQRSRSIMRLKSWHHKSNPVLAASGPTLTRLQTHLHPLRSGA